MAATGWTWEELQQTPAEIVNLMSLYLAVRSTKESGGDLHFDEDEA